jgi:hypothetical protein
VHGDGEHLLGVILPDNVLLEKIVNLPGRWNGREHRSGLGGAALLLADDVLTQINAIGAYVYAIGTFNYRTYFFGVAVAEAAFVASPAAVVASDAFRS